MTMHYHTERYFADDEDPYITGTVYEALDYAATELRELADMETSQVSFVAENVDTATLDDFDVLKDALKSYARAAVYDNLAINAQIRADNRTQSLPDRPPLFQDDMTDDNDSKSLLFQSAMYVVGRINAETPLGIWVCGEELFTDPDTGETFHKEDM